MCSREGGKGKKHVAWRKREEETCREDKVGRIKRDSQISKKREEEKEKEEKAHSREEGKKRYTMLDKDEKVDEWKEKRKS